jgi:hypothetical protein
MYLKRPILELSNKTKRIVALTPVEHPTCFSLDSLRFPFSNCGDQDLDKMQDFRVIETVQMSFLKCRDVIFEVSRCHFESVKIFSTVEMSFFKLSRSRLSIRTSRPPRLIVMDLMTCKFVC